MGKEVRTLAGIRLVWPVSGGQNRGAGIFSERIFDKSFWLSVGKELILRLKNFKKKQL
ncbi:MAG: hypothetical protein U0264_08290 [Candidatus Kapaibacterium sp.]